MGWGQLHHPGLGGSAQAARDQSLLTDGWGEEAVEAAEAQGPLGLGAGAG